MEMNTELSPRDAQQRGNSPPLSPSPAKQGSSVTFSNSQNQEQHVAPQPRKKRGRYATVACRECKRKKLKCLPYDGESCVRCIENDFPCVYLQGSSRSSRGARVASPLGSQHRDKDHEPHQHQNPLLSALNNEVSNLRQDLAILVQTVNAMQSKTQTSPNASSSTSHPSRTANAPNRRQSATAQQVHLVQPPDSSQGVRGGRPGEFIGPTRPAYAFRVGEGALTQMGIPEYNSLPPSQSLPPSRSSSPVETPTLAQYWSHSEKTEIDKFVQLWRDEVYDIYPFLDLEEGLQLQKTLGKLKMQASGDEDMDCRPSGQPGAQAEISSDLDTDILQIVVATGMVLDSGRGELANSMVESVRLRFFAEVYPNVVFLQRVQLLALLSIYYFHAGEELSSWRMIGLAARDALELGLHRKDSMFENFKDQSLRQLATRVFWCLYVLDRRWSFGTGLSFSLVDRDIDPELPEPGPEHAYLKSMVGYGRLCSKIWHALPPFHTELQPLPNEAVDEMDKEMQRWYHSIPFELQIQHPRLGTSPQEPHMQRLRTMLYLRGNHARCLLYRQYLLNPTTVLQNQRQAWLVVNIAEDSIEVLTHLCATTKIYARQPHAFHYFLMSALAIIFLAVCHAPDVFTVSCRKRFLEAVDLIKSFSQQSIGGRRLWKTIRSLLMRLKSLGIQQNGQENPATSDELTGQGPRSIHTAYGHSGRQSGSMAPSAASDPTEMMMPTNRPMQDASMDMLGSVPDLSPGDSGVDQDLMMSVFDALGQGYLYPRQDDVSMDNYAQHGFMSGIGGDILNQFQGFV